MSDNADRYSKLPDGRVLDSEPMKQDRDILVFDKASGKWVAFEGTLGQWRDSKPLTAREAARLTGEKTGRKRAEARKKITRKEGIKIVHKIIVAPETKMGPEPERLKITGVKRWEEAVAIAMRKPKPARGWPKK